MLEDIMKRHIICKKLIEDMTIITTVFKIYTGRQQKQQHIY